MLTRVVVRLPMKSGLHGTTFRTLQVRWKVRHLTLCLGRRRNQKGRGLKQVSKVLVVVSSDLYKSGNLSDVEGLIQNNAYYWMIIVDLLRCGNFILAGRNTFRRTARD